MAQTIRRGGKGVRKAAAARGTRAKVQTAKKTTGSAFDSFMRWMPFGEQTLYRIVLGGIFAVAGGVAWVVASAAGVPDMAAQKVAQVSSTAGFRFDHVQLRGVQRMNELQVYDQVLGDQQRAWTEVDVAAMRDRLMQLSWVKDARVARQLPDTLVIDIVERTPRAVLRKGDQLVLIDETGAELESVKEARGRGLLQLSGNGAGGQIAELDALLEAAPAIKPQVAEAEWVGNRRWNLTFKSGQVLALPEGEDTSSKALLEFARMDGVNRLLGGKVAYIDMRSPERTYLRVPGHAEEAAAEKAAAAAAKARAKANAAAAKAKEN